MISPYAWTRKGHGRPVSLPRVLPAYKGKAIVTEARGIFSRRVPISLCICATILAIAIDRMAFAPHSPASSLTPFKEPGAFSERYIESANCSFLIVQEMFDDVKEMKRLNKQAYRHRTGQLPAPMED